MMNRSRTKATGAQQKEANNINMSLMQLWRCLQGMKKRVVSIVLCCSYVYYLRRILPVG